MLFQKGQESAPFELLIAIIVMTFVIVIGFNALDKLNSETCKGNLSQNLSEIKNAIETVVKNKSKANVFYRLPGCFNDETSKLRVISRDSERYCSAYCGGSVQSCIVLEFSSDDPYYTDVKCLRVSQAVNFPESDPCNSKTLEPQDAYSVANWRDQEGGIKPGRYTLVSQFNLFSNVPEICAYRRVN